LSQLITRDRPPPRQAAPRLQQRPMLPAWSDHCRLHRRGRRLAPFPQLLHV